MNPGTFIQSSKVIRWGDHSVLQSILLWTIISCTLFSISCTRQRVDAPKHYLSAEINGMKWSADEHYSWFQMEYDYDLQYHTTHIYAQCEKLIDSTRYEISITHRYYPETGKYYFNNSPGSIPYRNGAAGTVYGWVKKNGLEYQFNSQSFNGFVEVLEINKSFLRGTFEFDAQIMHGPNTGDTLRVRRGIFFVPLTLVSGKEWNP